MQWSAQVTPTLMITDSSAQHTNVTMHKSTQWYPPLRLFSLNTSWNLAMLSAYTLHNDVECSTRENTKRCEHHTNWELPNSAQNREMDYMYM
jgi:hypothetical protein